MTISEKLLQTPNNEVRQKAPVERERVVSRGKLGITTDGMLEVISVMKDKNNPGKKMHSSDAGGGGHLSVKRSSGDRTTVLHIHGLRTIIASKKDMIFNKAKIAEIVAYLKLPPGTENAPLAVLSGCDLPKKIAANIAKQINRPLVIGDKGAMMLMPLKTDEKLSGDFRLHSKNGFSIVNPDGTSEKIKSKFVLLPRTPVMSKIAGGQKMAAYTRPMVSHTPTATPDPGAELRASLDTLQKTFDAELRTIEKKYFTPLTKGQKKRMARTKYEQETNSLIMNALYSGFSLNSKIMSPSNIQDPATTASQRPTKGRKR